MAKLKAARTRKRKATGLKVEGRKSHAEARPEVVALVKAFRRGRSFATQPSLRAISADLAERGYLNERGKPLGRSPACWRHHAPPPRAPLSAKGAQRPRRGSPIGFAP